MRDEKMRTNVIPQHTLQQIIDHIDLVDVINRYTTVNPNLKAICPFHDERKPSLSIHPSRKFFRCFGCDAKGDAFNFIQKIEGIAFIEAVKLLASEAGVPLPQSERFRGYVSRRSEERKSSCARLAAGKEVWRQAVLDRSDELLQLRKELPPKIRWNTWDAHDYLSEQIIDCQFDLLHERVQKVNEDFNREKRRIING